MDREICKGLDLESEDEGQEEEKREIYEDIFPRPAISFDIKTEACYGVRTFIMGGVERLFLFFFFFFLAWLQIF